MHTVLCAVFFLFGYPYLNSSDVVVDHSHLASLMEVLNPIVDWFKLGEYLKVSHAKLEKIEIEQRERVDRCKRDMLVAWLNSSTSTTKQDLQSALSKMIS